MQLLDEDITAITKSIQDISHVFGGKRVIITGGQGFLGQYVCATFNKLNEQYLEKPCQVIVVDNLITCSNASSLPKYNHFKYINESVEENIFFEDKIDYIIFLAGIASPFYYMKYPIRTINTVSIGLSNYLDIASEHKARLLFASSSEIYGNTDADHIPTKETYNGNVSTLSDRSCYDESKRLGETLCRVFHQQHKVDATIVRIFNMIGPLMHSNDYRVLPNFANNIINGNPVQLYGNGNQTRTFCYASDGIVGIIRALLLGRSGEAYNIGNPNDEISMKQLLDVCEEVFETEKIPHPPIVREIVPQPDKYPVNGDPARRCPDISKATNELKYAPQISLRTGLAKFLKWAHHYYTGSK